MLEGFSALFVYHDRTIKCAERLSESTVVPARYRGCHIKCL
jgi:hypothetical protein